MPGEERRRSHRVIIRISVTLEIMKSGEKVTVPAHTVAVNIHGAMVLCSRPIDADTQLEILNDRTQERAGARVTRASRDSAEGYLIPLEFTTPTPAFWRISFPPANWKSSDA
jgi:L-cysteine desulfidase